MRIQTGLAFLVDLASNTTFLFNGLISIFQGKRRRKNVVVPLVSDERLCEVLYHCKSIILVKKNSNYHN